MNGDSIVLEEEIDPNYEPSEEEILEYAKWLGFDVVADADLLYIAREGGDIHVGMNAGMLRMLTTSVNVQD